MRSIQLYAVLKRFAFLTVCIVSLACAGCAPRTATGQEHASGTIKIVTQVDDFVIITLESNRTTGYRWQVKEPYRKDILELVSANYLPDKTDRVGSGGREVWTFKATAEGVTTVTFVYKRPWEERRATDREARFVIAIQAAQEKRHE